MVALQNELEQSVFETEQGKIKVGHLEQKLRILGEDFEELKGDSARYQSEVRRLEMRLQ